MIYLSFSKWTERSLLDRGFGKEKDDEVRQKSRWVSELIEVCRYVGQVLLVAKDASKKISLKLNGSPISDAGWCVDEKHKSLERIYGIHLSFVCSQRERPISILDLVRRWNGMLQLEIVFLAILGRLGFDQARFAIIKKILKTNLSCLE